MRYVSHWRRRVQVLALLLAFSIASLIIVVVADAPRPMGFGGIWHVHIWASSDNQIEFAEDYSTGPPFSIQERQDLEWTSLQWFTKFDRRRVAWLPFMTPVFEEASVSFSGQIHASGKFATRDHEYWLNQIKVQGDENWPVILQDAFRQHEGGTTRIYWPGVSYLALQILSLLAIPVLILSGVLLFKLLKSSPKRLARENRCPRCQYVLKVEGTDTCSECGLTGVRDVQTTPISTE